MDFNNASDFGYLPTFTTNNGSTVICNVSGYLAPQNGLPICWAACVATTYNYYKGTNVTAKNVCDKMNHSYTKASTALIEKAFQTYNLAYDYTPYGLSLSLIRKHLKNGRLIPVSLHNSISPTGHIEVITGVKVTSQNKEYLKVYDPDLNKQTLTEFNNYNTVFPGSFLWAWQGSFHYYN